MIQRIRNFHGSRGRRPVFLASAIVACLASATPALAQADNLQGSGDLIRQDFSDCGNSNVNNSDPTRDGGNISITQTPAGDTTATVEITRGTPNTTYDFYWKCQRQLGSIRTGADGSGFGHFEFQAPPNQILTFDVYPDGAPAGNKFQSTPIALNYIGFGPIVRQDFSDCGNNNVSGADPSRIGGNIVALQNPGGATEVTVNVLAGTPNTGYNVYWKCQRQIGTVQTGANGTGSGTFSFQTAPGTVLTFDIYPDGAPAGNKFQSVRLLPAPAPGPRRVR
jgi:hypothetical protein